MIQLEEKFDGHIILYCKGHYRVKDVDFIVGLQRIFAVRCGLPFDSVKDRFNEYLASHLYEIIKTAQPKKVEYLHQIVHKDLANSWRWSAQQDLTPIEKLIWIYKDAIWQMQIKEGRKTLIKLPKPQKRVFRGIVSGKDKYNDYKLVK